MKASPWRDRFWAKVDKGSECWIWTACRNRGYGMFTAPAPSAPSGYKTHYAHRLAYMLVAGPLPGDMVLDHLCRNRACVNPAHLELVTQRENLLRGETIPARNSSKTHCKRGHALDGDNLIRINPPDGPRRQCRACKRMHDRNRNHKNPATNAAP